MTGRSSRTMNTHCSILITIEPNLSAMALKEKLIESSKAPLYDGLMKIDLMRGRRILKIDKDIELLGLFQKGWRFKHSKIEAKIGKKAAFE